MSNCLLPPAENVYRHANYIIIKATACLELSVAQVVQKSIKTKANAENIGFETETLCINHKTREIVICVEQ